MKSWDSSGSSTQFLGSVRAQAKSFVQASEAAVDPEFGAAQTQSQLCLSFRSIAPCIEKKKFMMELYVPRTQKADDIQGTSS